MRINIEDYFEATNGGQFLINGKWYTPLFGCDTIQHLLDELSSQLEAQVMQKIAGIRWENRYSTTSEDDKMGRWMRLGRINGMTVAIILKAKERFIVKLPNNKSDESLENAIIVTSENEAMLEAEKYIAKYVSNFSA